MIKKWNQELDWKNHFVAWKCEFWIFDCTFLERHLKSANAMADAIIAYKITAVILLFTKSEVLYKIFRKTKNES